MTTGRIGVVGVGLKVPAVDGEEALFLSRKRFQGEGREGQPDWGGQDFPTPGSRGLRERVLPRAHLPSVLDTNSSRP